MKKDQPAEPAEDIPAWFMTYSDVITLLMTFFILLLTFASTEPEKYDKITVAFSGKAAATGIAGHEHDKLDRDSWSKRIRPRAARVALTGSEMPHIESSASLTPKGEGIESVNEKESEKDVMHSYSFELPLGSLMNENNNLTTLGTKIAYKLAKQLRGLPIHCAIERPEGSLPDASVSFAEYLYEVERARPGQVAVAFNRAVSANSIRFVIERYER
ncbi:MAG: flagellar motor protein MotB [Pirellulaceae bacterium]